MTRIRGAVMLVFIILSCKKEDVTSEESGFVSFINAVPGIAPMTVYIDSVFQVRIPYRASYRNRTVAPGIHDVHLRDSANTRTILSITSQEFMVNTTSTIVVYDTLDPVDSTVKAKRLFDDLNLAPIGFVKVRFVHAAPLTPAVDVTFVRTSVNPFDSLTLGMQPYIGSVSDVQALSAFKDLPIGGYTLKIKAGGTQDTIMTSMKLTVSHLAGVSGLSGITTIYLTGGARSQPLDINLFRHFP